MAIPHIWVRWAKKMKQDHVLSLNLITLVSFSGEIYICYKLIIIIINYKTLSSFISHMLVLENWWQKNLWLQYFWSQSNPWVTQSDSCVSWVDNLWIYKIFLHIRCLGLNKYQKWIPPLDMYKKNLEWFYK